MSGWKPIETAPVNIWILCWSSWRSEHESPFFVARFTEVKREEDVLRSREGKISTYERVEKVEREWTDYGAEFWMPLDKLPKVPR